MHVANSVPLPVSVRPYLHEGDEKIFQVTLRNENMEVELTNIGCAITAIRTPDHRKVRKNIVAGFSDLLQYRINKDYFGCVVGRFTNRINNGRFRINGQSYQLSQNNGNNHLHGGVEGFGRKLWDLYEVIEAKDECGVVFSYCSPDGEEGYPGNLFVTVKYLLRRNNQLSLFYKAVTDKSTPVSLTNHSYFNLTGFEDPTIRHHLLAVEAADYTAKSDSNISTGEKVPVNGTALDFRKPKMIGQDLHTFPVDGGYDHSFILKNSNSKALLKAAILSEPLSGRSVTVYTDQPAIQVYTGNFWDGTTIGTQGITYVKNGGVALETQAFPDSPNHPHFPDPILHPGEVYESTTIYAFGVMEK